MAPEVIPFPFSNVTQDPLSILYCTSKYAVVLPVFSIAIDGSANPVEQDPSEGVALYVVNGQLIVIDNELPEESTDI